MDHLPADLSLCLGIAGLKKIRLRGRNTNTGGGNRTVWGNGASQYVKLTTAVAMELVSSSANDAAAGTGARTVLVTGLDSSYLTASETVTLNGTTPVATSNTYLAINSLTVATAGSTFSNVGTIDCRTVSGSVVKRCILAPSGLGLGKGQSQDFIYTIPANYFGVIKSIAISAPSNVAAASYTLNTHNVDGVVKSEGFVYTGLSATSISPGQAVMDFGTGLIVAEKTLIDLQVVAGGEVTAMADLFLINKSGWAWGTGA